jgi:hypothetical protein
MKTSYLFIFSLVLLITGFSATGSRTLAGFLSGIAGIILCGVALVRTILDEIG